LLVDKVSFVFCEGAWGLLKALSVVPEQSKAGSKTVIKYDLFPHI